MLILRRGERKEGGKERKDYQRLTITLP